MVILVTGAAGFIGSNYVLKKICDSSFRIIGLDKLTYSGNLQNLSQILQNPNFTFIQGDINDHLLISKILSEHSPNAIIHFAAESHVDRSIHGPEAFVETNVVGTFRLLEAVRKYWYQLNLADQNQFRFLHVSTDEVYGSLGPHDSGFTETTRYSPNSPYSASKAASDHFVRAYHKTYGLPTLITNCSNNYGPYQFPEKLIPLMILNALEGKPLPIYGDGQQIRDWLHVSDHCDGIDTVLNSGVVGQTYNIGGGCEMANLDVVKAVCTYLDEKTGALPGGPRTSLMRYVADRPGHDRRYAVDSSKIQKTLGWAPKRSFYEGLRETIDWYLENRSWVEDVRSGEYRSWIETNYAQKDLI